MMLNNSSHLKGFSSLGLNLSFKVILFSVATKKALKTFKALMPVSEIRLESSISELEKTLANESQRASDLKEKYIESREAVTHLENQMSELKTELEKFSRENSTLRSENEKLSCQLSEVSGKNLQSEMTMKNRNESLQKMVYLLEADLDRKKTSVEELESKLQGKFIN